VILADKFVHPCVVSESVPSHLENDISYNTIYVITLYLLFETDSDFVCRWNRKGYVPCLLGYDRDKSRPPVSAVMKLRFPEKRGNSLPSEPIIRFCSLLYTTIIVSDHGVPNAIAMYLGV
jgi:hypothetical protein